MKIEDFFKTAKLEIITKFRTGKFDEKMAIVRSENTVFVSDIDNKDEKFKTWIKVEQLNWGKDALHNISCDEKEDGEVVSFSEIPEGSCYIVKEGCLGFNSNVIINGNTYWDIQMYGTIEYAQQECEIFYTLWKNDSNNIFWRWKMETK